MILKYFRRKIGVLTQNTDSIIKKLANLAKNTDHNIEPWPDSISLPICSQEDDTTRPRRQGLQQKECYVRSWVRIPYLTCWLSPSPSFLTVRTSQITLAFQYFFEKLGLDILGLDILDLDILDLDILDLDILDLDILDLDILDLDILDLDILRLDIETNIYLTASSILRMALLRPSLLRNLM
jgi:hypothetical protein